MLTAYLGLLIGIVLIVYGTLSYTGSSALASVPILVRKGDGLWLAAMLLLAIAALLGWIGYIFAADLRVWRIGLAVVAVILGIVAWVLRPKPQT